MHTTPEELWAGVTELQQSKGSSASSGVNQASSSLADPITTLSKEIPSLTEVEIAKLLPKLTNLLKKLDPSKVSREDFMRILTLLHNISKGHDIAFGCLDYWSKGLHGTDDEIELLWDSAPAVEGGMADLEALVARYQMTGSRTVEGDDTNTISALKADASSEESVSVRGDSERIPGHLQVFLEEKVKAAVLTDVPAPIDQVAEIVQRLAGMSSAERLRQIGSAAKVLGISKDELADKVDAVVALQDVAEGISYGAVEPWPDPIDPAAVLDEVTDTILRYVVLSPEQAWAGALWITMTWFIDYTEIAPIGLIDAPERECGKSKLLEVFGLMVARPLQAANSSVSFIFRAIEAWQVCLLIDEGDTFLRDNDELKGIVNAGHSRANAFVGRSVAKGNDFEPKMFSVWSAKAIAGIRMDKHLPESTISRCIVFNLRRKTKAEKVERLRRADHVKFKPLIAKLARFAEDYGYQVQQARPLMPLQLSDRAADNWEPLFAIASCAGPEWLKRAEQAALAMSGKTDGTDSIGPEILADVQTVFTMKKVIKMRSAELLESLNADAEMAWATYNRGGHALTVRQLAKLLAGYGIKTRTVRVDKHKTFKGYYRDDFADAFARYLTSENDPDLRHIAPEALPAAEVAVSDGEVGVRNEHFDPDLAAQAEAEVDALIDAFQAGVAGTRAALPPLGSSGDSDVSGEGDDDDEAF